MKLLASLVRSTLQRFGYQLNRIRPPEVPTLGPRFDASRPLPDGAAEALRADHPRLAELRTRYARCTLPMALSTVWHGGYLHKELELAYFRGDNPYVWQFRNVGAGAEHKYYFYLRDLESRDSQGLLQRLGEDGAFGCWTFEYPGRPPVSRDLLDSVNELMFLDEHTSLLSRPGMKVLDIGAGYGRLAHRALTAAPGLGTWFCLDAIPESTFLCEYYLRHRGLADRACVVPLDEIVTRLRDETIDVAVNVHSFSEQGYGSIDGWVRLVAALHVPYLFIVPNDGDRLLATEPDGSKRPFDDVLEAHGYELEVKRPAIPDAVLRAFMNAEDCFLLYRRRVP